ncbi:pyridoxamine 5'-phosphate oxidase [Rhodohalobacter halophilus]|uniref:pyridoxamine 5'-phosphate oxidase n=1 Tax=Rhodohalobacter halophilus TaxID=1812810 RepID=UPI000AECC5DB|nr:pyridoxamine 5'-phosphate oxidase [Rhodohalobacter halophilus]
MFSFFKRWIPGRDEISKPKTAARQAVEMLRREYTGKPLLEEHVSEDPIEQFSAWFDEAVDKIITDPNAMIVATADQDGKPSSRTVLLKGFDENGFVFYTNYRSRKGRQILENPYVSITFYWPELMRQIHIEGVTEKVPEEQSDAYFSKRPAASQLSALASPQSDVVESREALENRLKEMEKKFGGGPIPRPENWGGFLVKPIRIEFWQGRLNRLHDRICYEKEGQEWKISRLSP